jgi:hypothetical protein
VKKTFHTFLPLFNGFYRAFLKSEIPFSPDAVPLDVFDFLREDVLSSIDNKLHDLTTEEDETLTYYVDFAEKHTSHGLFSPSFMVKCAYEIIAHALEVRLKDVTIDSSEASSASSIPSFISVTKRISTLPESEDDNLSALFQEALNQYQVAKARVAGVIKPDERNYQEESPLSAILNATMVLNQIPVQPPTHLISQENSYAVLNTYRKCY